MRLVVRSLAIIGWGIAGFFASLTTLSLISGIYAGATGSSTNEVDPIIHTWLAVAFGVFVIMLVLGLFGRLPGTRRRGEPPCVAYPAGAPLEPGVLMRISYENKFWDLVGFQFYAAIRSPLTIIIWAVVLINLCWTTFAGSKDQTLPMRILTTVLMGVVVVIIFFGVYGLICVTIFISRKNRSFLTQHTLTFTADSLVEETQYNRAETKWAGIVKVARTANYLFIYVTQHSAHVIPRRAVPQSDWDTIYQLSLGKIAKDKPAAR